MLRWSRAREDVDTREHIVYIQGDEEESYRTSMQNFEHKNHKHICTTCAGQHTQREIERENRTIITSIRCDANNARWPRRGGHKREGHREKMAYNKRMLAYEFVLQILLQSHLIQFVCANVLCVCVVSVYVYRPPSIRQCRAFLFVVVVSHISFIRLQDAFRARLASVVK